MMDTFLALADIHGKTDMLARILKEHSQVKVIFAAGDLTNFGREGEAEKVLSVFTECVPNASLFFVGGNCDSLAARRFFEKHPGYIEQGCTAYAFGAASGSDTGDTVRIIGCGGGLLHTGLTPFEVRDEELGERLRRAHARCASTPSSERLSLVVLTHTPPRDTFADLRHLKHLGSQTFATMLYEYEPLVWICGHIHEGRSVQWEGRTLVINPGPAALGSYALLRVDQGAQGPSVAAELRAL